VNPIQSPPGRPWGVLVWDPAGSDGPCWLIGVIDPGGALAGEAQPSTGKSVIAWLARATGLRDPKLTSMPGALVWRIHEPNHRGEE
jgi:hypothetical protein